MVKPDETCMFCGFAPCQCGKPAKKAPPVVKPVEQVVPVPAYDGEYSNEITGAVTVLRPDVVVMDSDMAYAVKAVINGGLVDKSEADRLKALVGINVPSQTKEAIHAWKQRRAKG